MSRKAPMTTPRNRKRPAEEDATETSNKRSRPSKSKPDPQLEKINDEMDAVREKLSGFVAQITETFKKEFVRHDALNQSIQKSVKLWKTSRRALARLEKQSSISSSFDSFALSDEDSEGEVQTTEQILRSKGRGLPVAEVEESRMASLKALRVELKELMDSAASGMMMEVLPHY